MANSHVRYIEDYKPGSSDRPILGMKRCWKEVEQNELEIITNAINTLRCIDPNTNKFDVEKTNKQRQMLIDTKTNAVDKLKGKGRGKGFRGETFYRVIETDSENLIILHYQTEKPENFEEMN